MENKQVRFRDAWFIRAGLGIIALSGFPFTSVALAGLIFRKNIEVGPTFLWFLLGAAFGFLAVMLGTAGVIVRRLSRKAPPR
jgi:hypothetical protein